MNSSSRSIDEPPVQPRTSTFGMFLNKVPSPSPFPGLKIFHSEADTAGSQTRLSRRRVLQILGTGALTALTQGCALELDLTHQNFRVRDYHRLTNEPQRTEIPLEDAQLMTFLTETIQTEFGFCPDFSQFFHLSFNGQYIQTTPLIDAIKDPWAVHEILRKFGFDWGYMTIFENGIIFNCDKNGQHLYVVVDSNRIYIEGQGRPEDNIENNSVVVKIRPAGGSTEAKPTALAIDVIRTKTYSDQSSNIDQSRKVIGGDGSRAFSNKGSGYFQFRQAKSRQLLTVNDAPSFLQFLQNCQSTEMISEMLATENPFYDTSVDRNPFFQDIDSIETIRQMLELIPKQHLRLLCRFLSLAVRYQKKDRVREDEYRAPDDTLQSGWADCDDYAVINAFWSYLHGYRPFYVVFYLPQDADGNKRGHVFVWYNNEEGRIVILDNYISTVLEEGETVADYIGAAWPGAEERLDVEA